MKLPHTFAEWSQEDKRRAIDLLIDAVSTIEALQRYSTSRVIGAGTIERINQALGLTTEGEADGKGCARVQ